MITNRKHTKEFILAAAQQQVPGIRRVGQDVLDLAEAAATKAVETVVKQCVAQHRRTNKTLSAPTMPAIAPSAQRRSTK